MLARRLRMPAKPLFGLDPSEQWICGFATGMRANY
jgi:hypothetical protein